MLFLTKRYKILITIFLLCLGLFLLPDFGYAWRKPLLAGILLGSYLLSAWVFYHDLKGIEFLTLFVLPVFFTLTVGLTYLHFLPTIVFRLAGLAGFGGVMYVILLAENIFNVAAERSIPLVRAAHTVGYLATLAVAFALFSLLYNLYLNSWLIGGIAFITSSFLFLQAFWQIELEDHLNTDLMLNSLVLGLVVGEIAFVFSFWPLQPFGAGLALTTALYVFLGIVQHKLKGNLSQRAVGEYVFVSSTVFALMIFLTHWGA
ncbi:MAG: hypothetical protein M1150_02395 [Patescibacteria group bacterium]|nr:hypothetical protein [Patescibacteria group bacterium]